MNRAMLHQIFLAHSRANSQAESIQQYITMLCRWLGRLAEYAPLAAGSTASSHMAANSSRRQDTETTWSRSSATESSHSSSHPATSSHSAATPSGHQQAAEACSHANRHAHGQSTSQSTPESSSGCPMDISGTDSASQLPSKARRYMPFMDGE